MRTWEALADPDGDCTTNQRQHADRDVRLRPRAEGGWTLTGNLPELAGCGFAEFFAWFCEAEWRTDWADARNRLGGAATTADLARTEPQRRADALLAMARAAASTPAVNVPRRSRCVARDRPERQRDHLTAVVPRRGRRPTLEFGRDHLPQHRPDHGTLMRLDEIGERDGWRCWLCDEPVDPDMSVNDPRGPSIDSRTTERKAKNKGNKAKGTGSGTGQERLAHRACNTGKGGTKPVVEWPDHLFVADPAVILTTVERMQRKGGREVVGRCVDRNDAVNTADWIVDRISRLEPTLAVTADVEPGGGQYLVVLRTT